MRTVSRHVGFIAVLLASFAACGPGSLGSRSRPAAPSDPAQAAGPGYFVTARPAGVVPPSNRAKKPVRPKVTSDFVAVPTSNDWWSSLIWQFDRDAPNPHSEPLFAHPLSLKAQRGGLGLAYVSEPTVDQRDYMFHYAQEVLVGLQGVAFPNTKVAGYSDWTVTAAFQTSEHELRATFGHGLPFVYFERLRGKAPIVLSLAARAEVYHQGDEWLGFRVGKHVYAAFAPSGSTWKIDDASYTSDLGGKGFFSLAVLPDAEPATLELFRRHAYAFVTGTQVSWAYDEATANAEATFSVQTRLMEEGKGRVNEPLQALYRHQWLNTAAPLTGKSYASPRGEMKLLAGSAFKTRIRFNGVLPMLPNVAQGNHSDLEFYVKQVYWQDDLFPPGLGDQPRRDPYWVGKSLLKVGQAMEIADQIGYESARNHLLQALKNELEDWFDGRAPSLFYYDSTWRTLIGVPTNFGSSDELNDHHFHHGYFVYAAALVARHDPAWAERWAPFVELLLRDPANWDRADSRFPFLRYMDVYAGHSWANGPALFVEGNNQEASSEDTNFSAAAILWGSAVGNEEIRDLGIFLYTQQVQAIEQYWFDVDDAVFPPSFDHTTVAMVWGAGGRYDTWWDNSPVYIHGINLLPNTGGALYFGRRPDYVARNWAELVRRNRGEPLSWRDPLWMFLAYADPTKARELFERDPYFTPEFGSSTALTYHVITNLEALGRLSTKVTASSPTAATFERDGRRTHVAYNASAQTRAIEFSDGATLRVPPRSLVHDARSP